MYITTQQVRVVIDLAQKVSWSSARRPGSSRIGDCIDDIFQRTEEEQRLLNYLNKLERELLVELTMLLDYGMEYCHHSSDADFVCSLERNGFEKESKKENISNYLISHKKNLALWLDEALKHCNPDSIKRMF